LRVERSIAGDGLFKMTRGVKLLEEENMSYVVKRYSNRKLYDVQESRYVTLEELEDLIRSGRQISVVDAATGEDLTSVTLAQIILESERNRRAALPTGFLHQLIKHGEAWQEFVQKSLRASLEGVITSQREADRILKEWAARAGMVPAGERAARAGQEPEAERDAESLRDEVETLKEKLRDLEEKLERRKSR
jgi:polyhydroxyalkanoate synthesis repressor PhaR